MAVKIFRINYKSDFILTLESDAGWMTPFCIKFWTGAPSQAFYAGWDGETYTHCSYDTGEPTKLVVQFDDHHLPIGELKFQIAYHFTVADFPHDTEDEVINPANITIEIDGQTYQVMLDFTGETAPEIEFSLPAYANEAQRIANEQARIAAEQQRISNEENRISAEETRQQNEQQRIQHEEERVSEFAHLKSESEAATTAANAAATLANEKSQLAADKAALAQAAATLANEKAQLAADKAALAQTAATLANEKAALAQQKAVYAQSQGDYAKAQGDYAKEQGDTAQADHVRAEADHTRAESDHAAVEVFIDSLGVFDLSKYNAVGGVLATYADLSAALTALTALDSKYKYGGMSFKFVQSSVNKYVQWRLMTDEFSTDVEDWEQAASAAKLDELEDNVVMTGSYDATVAVGLADNLRGDDIVSAEFYKRKTGGTQSVGSGIAAIKEMRGKSIVWNQLVRNGNFVSTNKWDVRGGTISVANNVLTLTCNEGVGAAQLVQADIKLIGSHKIYCNFEVFSTYDNVVRWGYSGQYFDTSTKSVSGGVWTKVTQILTTFSGGVSNLYLYSNLNNCANYTYPTQLKNVYCIDLTLMFGAGNEPATVAEFEKMFHLDYYDYNAGEVIPFAGQNLTTTGKNQYNPANGKANLLGGQTYQIGGTYTSAEIDGVAVTLDSNNCFTTTKDCVIDIIGGNDTDTIVALYNGEDNTYEPYEKHTLPLDPSQWRDKQGNLVFPYGGMHGAGTTYDYAKVDADGYIRKAMKVYERRAYESGDAELTNVITDGTTYTFYPLDTPVEVELATPVYAKYLVDKDGTEEITPANGATPYTTPANLSILYAMDARGEIKNLPKNYLSKESAENMLNAMVSAGVIASYTMTYDAANARYQFTFVKAKQASTNTVNNESNI